MRLAGIGRAPVALLLTVTTVVLPVAAGAQVPPPAPTPSQALLDFEQGKSDGERAAHGSIWWFLSGCGGGCAGLLSAAYITPQCLGIALGVAGGLASVTAPFSQPPYPSGSIYIGRSQDYVRGYTEGFQQRGMIWNIVCSSSGCLSGVAAGAVVVYAISQSAQPGK